MSQYNKVCEIIKSLRVTILTISRDKFHFQNNVLNIPRDYKETEDNDILFRMLYLSGQSLYKKESPYNKEQKSVIWAIEQATQLGLRISANTVADIHRRLHEIEETDFKYDVSDICDSNATENNDDDIGSLSYLLEAYGYPIDVRKNNWPENVFFKVENVSKFGTAHGSIFINDTFFKESSYSNNYALSDIFNLYVPKVLPDIPDNNEYISDIDYNEKIKDRIKGKDIFKEYISDDERLLNHQKAGCLLARRYDKFAFFYDTGTGKTIMSLAVINEKHKNNGAKFMIVAPLAIIRTAWMEDSQEFFPDMRILPLSKNYKKSDYYDLYTFWAKSKSFPQNKIISQSEWNVALKSDYNWDKVWNKMILLAQHYIINIEKYRTKTDHYLKSFNTNGLVMDESAILKNYASKTSKTMLDVSKSYKYVYLLSGKPAPNNSTEYYTQMKIVDPVSFDMTNANFIKRYFTKDKSQYYFKDDYKRNIVANLISRRSLIVSKEDCLILPDIHYNTIDVFLSSKEMDYYDQMFEGCLNIILQQEKEYAKKNIYYSTNCKLAVLTKLRQIASGFFIENKQHVNEIHDKKLNKLLEIIGQNRNENILIWCQYEYEIQLLEKVLAKYGRVVTAYGKSKNIDENIRAFKKGEAQYMIAHPKSIKYGVTFTEHCCKAVYYSLSYSAEDYYQSRDRIYRLGQKKDCDYYFLIAKDTIDEIMLDCIWNKMNSADLFSKIVKHAADHGIDYSKFLNKPVDIKDNTTASGRKIIDKYKFVILDNTYFSYEKNGESFQSTLYNTLLPTYDDFNAEEILFEIGKAELCDDDNNITVKEIEKVACWVLSELKNEKIKSTQRCSDYLNEQVEKQREIDIAHGKIGETTIIPVQSISNANDFS